MCVSEAWRRRRLGTRLLATLQAFAAAEGHTRVFLTTPVFNVAGVAMYRAAGFVSLPDTKDFGGIEIVEMEWLPPVKAPVAAH